MNRRLRFASAAICALLAASGPLATFAQEPVGGQIPEAALAFRTTFGLNSDLTWISSVAQHFEPSQWGIPLTAAEERDIETRVAVQDSLGNLDPYLDASWFAGVWLDQQAGGEVVIEAAGRPTVTASDLLKALPAEAYLTVRVC